MSKKLKMDESVKKLTDSYGNWFQEGRKNCAGNAALMTKELYPYTDMFSPIVINRMKVKNRLVMAPMGNLMMCEEFGRPNEKMIQYFTARAKGGVGLITSGLVPISDKIDPTVSEPKGKVMMPRISPARTLLSGWRDLAQGCHAFGAKFFIQLTPGLGRVGPPTCLVQQYKMPVSASFNPNFYIPEIPCLPLTDLKLMRIIKNAGQAAADAKVSGIDGVYLHGHEGYLLEQMTNKAFNKRLLSKYASPHRFGLDIIKEIRKRVGPNYPIMYRIDLSLALNETYGDRMHNVKSLKHFKNGRSIEETLEYMKALVEVGVDIFDVDLGCYDNWWLPHPPGGMPAGCFIDIAKIAKDYFKKNNIKSNAGVEVPVVAVGKLGYPDVAEKALRDEKCDMVMLGRPLLADPEWANKAFRGDVDRICPCISCQEGCVNEFIEGNHIQCAVNARTGFEEIIPEEVCKADVKKRIAVIGSGPSGITFAVNSAKRGHEVTLFEKEGKIGGRVVSGSVPAIKFDFLNYLKWLEKEVEVACESGNLKLCLNTEVTVADLKDKYDTVVFAAGSTDICPRIEGIDKIKTVQAVDLLLNPELIGDAKNIVIAGGGVVGCETAYFLKYEHNKDVKVIEMAPHFMMHVCTANRGHVLHYLDEAGVEMLNATRVVSFDEKHVNVVQNVSSGVPNPVNTWQPLLPENIGNPLAKKIGKKTINKAIPADLIVLALGNRSNDFMYEQALKNNIAKEVFNIGDSFAGGKVLEAVRAGFRLAQRV